MSIVSGKQVVLAIRLELPPNIAPEQAVQLLSQGGVNIPLGLVQFVRQTVLGVVESGESFTVPPMEEGGAIMRVM